MAGGKTRPPQRLSAERLADVQHWQMCSDGTVRKCQLGGYVEAADYDALIAKDDKWQPIETAPMETNVLVCGPDWAEGSEACHYDEEGWYLAGDHPTDSDGGQVYPTHWQPLPAPPAPPAKRDASETGEA